MGHDEQDGGGTSGGEAAERKGGEVRWVKRSGGSCERCAVGERSHEGKERKGVRGGRGRKYSKMNFFLMKHFRSAAANCRELGKEKPNYADGRGQLNLKCKEGFVDRHSYYFQQVFEKASWGGLAEGDEKGGTRQASISVLQVSEMVTGGGTPGPA